ncbi:Na+/H+ antiporter subunit E, partial [Haloarcula sp. Atlit-120R]
ANSITLTPGTLTMDYDDDTNTLYVHSIDGSDLDGILEPIRRWEDYALVIFDEELKPGDPAPQAQANGEDSKTAAVAGGERHG